MLEFMHAMFEKSKLTLKCKQRGSYVQLHSYMNGAMNKLNEPSPRHQMGQPCLKCKE